MFLDSAGKYSPQIHHHSYKSAGVPGTVAGFALAHERYGKASWSGIVDPAVKLASEGFAQGAPDPRDTDAGAAGY